jgi:NAD(P)-dependent dehydrogenase (short-subunit alcohol dehydrogenase family)
MSEGINTLSAATIRHCPAASCARRARARDRVNQQRWSRGGRHVRANSARGLRVADEHQFLGRGAHDPRAFLPILERQTMAQLVNVSSSSGIVAAMGQTAYAASQFALRGFSESLCHELEDKGSTIGVTIVLPGGVRTAIATSARRPGVSPEESEAQQKMHLLRLSPADAAERIVRGIENREKRVLVGSDVKQTAVLQRLMPSGY